MTGFSSFKDLKKNRGALKAKIAEAVQEKSSFNDKEAENSWYPVKDDKGACSTTIRFLPPAHGQTLPWVKRYRHAFKENGKWLFENCPTTIGKDCVICAKNKELWDTEITSNRDLASKRKRNIEYFYNIYVVDDKTQEGVTGTNKIFKSGPYVFKMIQSALNPEFDDDPKIDAFDLWEGADFNFKMFIKDKQLTYERSVFKSPSVFLDGDDDKLEEVYNGMHDLGKFIDEKLFNSAENIEKNFNRVTGAVDAGRNTKTAESAIKEKTAQEDSSSSVNTNDIESSDADSEDVLAMLEKMANA